MKIIFSRKGFDSSYGSGASPILPSGDLLSIPIPSNTKIKEKGIPYQDLRFGNRTYLQIIQELGLYAKKSPSSPPRWSCGLFAKTSAKWLFPHQKVALW